MAYSGYGRAAYTPGERRLPAAHWMIKAQTCPMFLFSVLISRLLKLDLKHEIWHKVAMDAQHTTRGKKTSSSTMDKKCSNLPNFSFIASAGDKTKFETPGEKRLPAAQWMGKAQTCTIFLLLQQPVTKDQI